MIDLHLHLDGSLNPENISTLAEMAGVTLSYTDPNALRAAMTVSPDCADLREYLEKFDLPLRLLQRAACIEYAVYGLMRDLKAQGLCYGEIRFAPQLHLQQGLTQSEVAQAAINGRNKGIRELGITVNLILCCMRGEKNHAENAETVLVAQQFLGKGVCAVDLAGNEAAHPTEEFADIFALAKQKGVPAVIHAGEAAGPDSVWHALAMGARRIGHGIHALEDDRLMNALRERKIYTELCYSSNLQTKAVVRAEAYPLVTFLSRGIGVTLNTDNLTVSDTTLQREYRLVQQQFGLSEETMKRIAINALEAAFLPAREKETLRQQIDSKFSAWLGRSK